MTEEEMRQHALRLAESHMASFNYSDIYEDEYLEDATEDDWQSIFDIIIDEAKVSID